MRQRPDGTAEPVLNWRRRAVQRLFADGQIAAIAATEELTVVTQNASDFEPFVRLEEGIDVENWFTG